MKYPVQKIIEVKEALDALPAVSIGSKECVSSREAIALLSDTLLSLQARGYSVEMLARELHGRGIDLALSTLRRYLKRPREEGSAKHRKARKAPPSANKGASGSQAPANAHVQPAPARAAKTTLPQNEQAPPNEDARRGQFDVRQDTDDL